MAFAVTNTGNVKTRVTTRLFGSAPDISVTPKNTAPVSTSGGGVVFKPGQYVIFPGTSLASSINFGSQTVSVGSSGVSIKVTFMFMSNNTSGVASDNQRLVDFNTAASGVDNLILTKVAGTNNLMFAYRNGSGTQQSVTTSGFAFETGVVYTVVAIYDPSVGSTGQLSIYAASGNRVGITPLATSTPSVKASNTFTYTSTYIGRSSYTTDQPLIAQIYSLGVYKRVLGLSETIAPNVSFVNAPYFTGFLQSSKLNVAYMPATPKYTIALWVHWIGGTNFVSTDALALGTNGTAFVGFHNAIPFTIGGTIVQNTWQHVAIAYATGSMRLFINGVKVVTTSVPVYTASGIGQVVIGNGWKGYLDDFRIYPASLPDKACADLYSYETALTSDTPITANNYVCQDIGIQFGSNVFPTTTSPGTGELFPFGPIVFRQTTRLGRNVVTPWFLPSKYFIISPYRIAEDYSLAFWYYAINLTGSSVTYVLLNMPTLSLVKAGANFTLAHTGSPAFTLATGLAVDNQWQHIVVTYETDYNVASLFINGVNVASDVAGGTSPYSSSIPLTLAANMTGSLDDLRLYNGRLTDTDCLLLYNAERGLPSDASLPAVIFGQPDFTLNFGEETIAPLTDVGFGRYAVTKIGAVTIRSLARNGQNVNTPFLLNGLKYLRVAYNLRTDFSVALWIYPTATSPCIFIDTTGITFGIVSGNYVLNNTVIASVSPFPIDTWTHVTLTYLGDFNTSNLFVDGTQIATNVVVSGAAAYIPNLSTPVTFGASFSGSLDSIRVYTGILTATEVSSLYAYELAVAPDPVIAPIVFTNPDMAINFGTGIIPAVSDVYPQDGTVMLDSARLGIPNIAPIENAPTFTSSNVQFIASSSQYINTGPVLWNVETIGFTIVADVIFTGLEEYYEGVYCAQRMSGGTTIDSGNAGNFMLMRSGRSQTFIFRMYDDIGRAYQVYTPYLAQNRRYIIVCTFDPTVENGLMSISLDGTVVGTLANLLTGPFSDDTYANNCIGCLFPGAYYPANIDMYKLAVFNRVVTPRELNTIVFGTPYVITDLVGLRIDSINFEYTNGVVYIPFESSVTDVISNTVITRQANPVTFTSGIVGQCAIFGGNTSAGALPQQYYTMPNVFTGYPLSIAFRFKPLLTTYTGHIFNITDGAGTSCFNVTYDGVGLSIATSTSLNSGVLIVGEWIHVAITVDASYTSRMYINGAQVSQQAGSFNMSTFATTIVIGGNATLPPTNGFNGMIDEIRMFQRALLPSEVSTQYETVTPINTWTRNAPFWPGSFVKKEFIPTFNFGQFGYSVALSGDHTTIVVGAPEASRAFVYDIETETLLAELPSVAGSFGNSVATNYDGTVCVVGAPTYNGGAGYAAVFDTASGTVLNVLTGAGNQFGFTVSMSEDGSRVLVGTPGVGGSGGYATVFSGAGYATTASLASGAAQWATRIGGTGADIGTGISVDSAGNSYVTGYYNSSPVTIYNADTTTFGTLANSANYDAYIVKYNTSGTAQWTTRIGGTNIDIGNGISVDSAGNSYVTGQYLSNPVTIYNAGGSTFGTLANSGSNDAFIVKYNTSGTAQWATRIGGTGSDTGTGISVDSAGNSYITGNYTSSPVTIYNADTTTFGTLANSGADDAYIVKYNTSGTAQWATHIGGTSTDLGYGISVDSAGNSYVTGYYGSNPVTIYNADTTTFGTLANSANYDAYIVKYNTSGAAQWTTRIAGSSFDQGINISVDVSGNSYVTGYYNSSPVTIYNAGGSTFGTLANSGADDAFIVKYNTSGTAQWTTRIGGTGSDTGNGISVDVSGNVYVTGHYLSSPVTIYNADTTTFGTLANSGADDAYIVKYNTSGTAQWATHIGGTSSDLGHAISVDVSGNVYVTGSYLSSPLTIYNAGGSTFGTLANSGSTDAFIVKYASLPTGDGSYYGHTVSLSGDGTTAYVSAPNDGDGVVRAFSSSGTFLNTITRASGTYGYFGFSVSTNSTGTRVIIGAPTANNNTGFAGVYSSDGALISTPTNVVGLYSQFGFAVAISGDGLSVFVGTPFGNVNILRSGYAALFNAGTGTLTKQIEQTTFSFFGVSGGVSYDGSYGIVGGAGPANTPFVIKGSVLVFNTNQRVDTSYYLQGDYTVAGWSRYKAGTIVFSSSEVQISTDGTRYIGVHNGTKFGVPDIVTWPVSVFVTIVIGTTATTITKTSGGSAWNGLARTTQSYPYTAYMTATPSDTTSVMAFGLSTATSVATPSLNYAWLFSGSAAIIFENGTSYAGYGVYTTSTVFQVTYDSTKVSYYKDGELQRTTVRAPGLALYGQANMYTIGSAFKGVDFGYNFSRIEFDKWQHIAYTYLGDYNISNIYVNGQLQAYIAVSPPNVNITGPYVIGLEWQGYIDDVRTYSRVMSPDQILAMYTYESTLPPEPTPLSYSIPKMALNFGTADVESITSIGSFAITITGAIAGQDSTRLQKSVTTPYFSSLSKYLTVTAKSTTPSLVNPGSVILSSNYTLADEQTFRVPQTNRNARNIQWQYTGVPRGLIVSSQTDFGITFKIFKGTTIPNETFLSIKAINPVNLSSSVVSFSVSVTDGIAIGGDLVTDISGRRIHIFTSPSSTLTMLATGSVDMLLVAGGGGAGGGYAGGGGGAGGLIFRGAETVAAGSYSVTVGLGGSGSYGAAPPSSGRNTAIGSLFTAIGGGAGGADQTQLGGVIVAARTGGSGGGGSANAVPAGNGTAGQGYKGGTAATSGNSAGGGGGAGGVGGSKTVIITSEAGQFAQFGFASAISADSTKLLVGAPYASSGAGYAGLFNTETGLVIRTFASTAGAGARFGSSVGISSDGSRVIVGASPASSGAGYAAVFDGTNGALIATLVGAGNQFGFSVAISGDGTTAIAGTPGVDGLNGYVNVYTGATYATVTPVAYTPSGDEYFGHSVSVTDDGSLVLVGGPNKSSGSGYAAAFDTSTGIFFREFTSQAGAFGYFGFSVAISADATTVIVGAPTSNVNAGYAATYVVATGIIKSSMTNVPLGSSQFGYAVGLNNDGSVAIVSAPLAPATLYGDQGGYAALILASSGVVIRTFSTEYPMTGASVSISNDSVSAVGAAVVDMFPYQIDGGVSIYF